MQRLLILSLLILSLIAFVGLTPTAAQNRPTDRNNPPPTTEPTPTPEQPDEEETPTDEREFSTVQRWNVGDQQRMTLSHNVVITIHVQGQEVLQVQSVNSVTVQTVLAIDEEHHMTRMSQRFDHYIVSQESYGMVREIEHPLLGHTLIYDVADGRARLAEAPEGVEPQIIEAVREISMDDGTPATVRLGQSWLVPMEMTRQQMLQGMNGQGDVEEARQEMEFSAIGVEGEGDEAREIGVFTGTLTAVMNVMGLRIESTNQNERRMDLATAQPLSSTVDGSMRGGSEEAGVTLEGTVNTSMTYEYGHFPAEGGEEEGTPEGE